MGNTPLVSSSGVVLVTGAHPRSNSQTHPPGQQTTIEKFEIAQYKYKYKAKTQFAKTGAGANISHVSGLKSKAYYQPCQLLNMEVVSDEMHTLGLAGCPAWLASAETACS